jgi:hypothetical protein
MPNLLYSYQEVRRFPMKRQRPKEAPEHSQDKGLLAQLMVELRAADCDFTVSRPTGQARYDLILDDGTRLFRVQVKYCGGKPSHSTGAYVVWLLKGKHRERKKPYTAKEIDAVVAYIPEEDALAWLPPALFAGKSAVTIRVKKPKNGQRKGILFLKDVRW